MFLCLFLVCLIGSAALGGVYVLTKDAIDAVNDAKVNDAIAAVVPAFDNSPKDEAQTVDYKGKSYTVYPARKEGVPVGYAIQSMTTKGFGGAIVLMVGFTPDGTIHNIRVVSHAETPGLGEKMCADKSDFIARQFPGKNPAQFVLKVKKDKGDVDAITAATISSRAFCDAVQTAYDVLKQLNSENR